MIDRLVLGTVQLGLDYGINNKYGKPSRKDAFRILDKAYELGIKTLDTAEAYGDAEVIIGEWLSANGLQNSVKVISKLKPNIFDNENNISGIIQQQIVSSLENLNIDVLDGFLLHTPKYVYQTEILEGLLNCKNKGMVDNLGVSIYDEEDALYAAGCELVDYIQIPYSFLDQRLDKTDFFHISKKNQKTVFARSPFVQGLVFMDENSIPSHLEKAKDYNNDLVKIISSYNLKRHEIAMLFSLSNRNNDYIVFGVDTVEQLIEDCSLVNDFDIINNCINDLKREFGHTDKNIVIPSLWKK